MKISEMIKALQHIEKEFGDLEAYLQNNPKGDEGIDGYET